MSSEKYHKNNLRIEQEEIQSIKLNCINGYFPQGTDTICICNEGYTTSKEPRYTNGFLDKCNEKISSSENVENIIYEYSEENVNVIYEKGKMSVKSIIFYICLIILIVILITWLSCKILKKIKKYCFCCLCCCCLSKKKKKKNKTKVEEESVKSYENSNKNKNQNKKKNENINQSFTTEVNPLKMLNSKRTFYICQENGNVIMEIKNKLIPNAVIQNLNQGNENNLNGDNNNSIKKENKNK